MNKHVIDDARRCLQCKKPQCSEGCPLHTPIRDAIRLLLDGKIEQAGKMIFDNNPLSIACSHVCPQENQCEGHCVMNKTGMPVNISEIEKYISSFYLSTCSRKKSDKWAGKVGIIGSGPAGMTIAFLLLGLNYSVTIYEGSDYAGGVMRYGIPEFRLPKKNLDELTKMLTDMGAVIRPNTTIGANLTVDDLFRDGFDAVFIGTGVWKPQRLDIKGESLGNIHYAIEYLRNPDAYSLGDSLIVIGSGNTAMDVARTAIRHGCREVSVVCNWDEKAVTARAVELDYAKIDGVSFRYKKSVVEFRENGAVFADSVQDENGIRPLQGTEELIPADSVIIAIGQAPRAVIVSSTSGIGIGDSGLVSVDESGRTTRMGVFASGDVVTGAKTVVEAVRVSKRVAAAIDDYVKTGKWQNAEA
ncbi:MAG: NAD(P)-dependent oxidoreductase [Clostridiales bacterium]|nr:NAD(P)-dependent oxidoreductase [Clostridiales bacterium]